MLARARFETETPNVIDAGEDAPSRPSRKETAGNNRKISSSSSSDSISSRRQNGNGDNHRHSRPWGVDENSNNGSITSVATSPLSFPNDTRQQGRQSTNNLYTASNKGHISRGIRINYGVEADEEPDASPPFVDEDGDSTELGGITATAYSDSPYGYRPSNNTLDGDGLQLRGQRSATVATAQQQQQQQQQTASMAKRYSSVNPQENERSMREARLFAAAMLNESDRRINLHNEHNLSLKQESTSSLRQMMTKAVTGGGSGSSSRRFYDEISLVEEPMIRPHDPRKFRHNVLCRLVAALVSIGVVALFGIFAVDAIRTRGDNSNRYTATDRSRMDSTIAFLFEQEISTARVLYDESTPQYQAAKWLALEDPEQLEVPSAAAAAAAAAGGGNNGLRNLNNIDPYRFVQRYTLGVLYFALGGDQWVRTRKFVSADHECSWFESTIQRDGVVYAIGVTCDENLRVRNLLLPNNNLEGALPPELRHLSKLDFLDLRNNTLTGSIPTELKALDLLTFLDMNVNQITGTIPHWLGDSLHRLEALGLSDNLLYGSIPASLATGLARNLKSLSLDGNMLTGDVAPLQHLRYLQYLYLNDNDLVGDIERGLLADMRFLKQVDLSGNRLIGKIPNYLFFMESLTVLDLSNNEMTGAIPFDTVKPKGVSSLEFLSFRNNSLSGSIPEALISHAPALYHLDLSFNQLTGDCPGVIGATLRNMTYLFLGDNSLSLSGGTIPDHLQSLTMLRELSLGNSGLQGPIPRWIEDLELLSLLDLSENQLAGSIDLDFSKLNHLRYLLLHDNQLSGSLPDSMKSLENLRVLALHLNNITDGQVAPSICADLPHFEFMTVDCKEIDCPCCDECCDSDTCFETVIWETLEHGDGNWEENFQHSESSFNPHILLTGAKFEGVLECGDDC